MNNPGCGKKPVAQHDQITAEPISQKSNAKRPDIQTVGQNWKQRTTGMIRAVFVGRVNTDPRQPPGSINSSGIRFCIVSQYMAPVIYPDYNLFRSGTNIRRM